MDTELRQYIIEGVKLEKDITPTEVFAFISTGCHYSQGAVKQLNKMDIVCNYYAIDRNQFVDGNLHNIKKGNLTEFWKTNVQYICAGWSYPHVFFKDETWHYVGGSSDIQNASLRSLELKL